VGSAGIGYRLFTAEGIKGNDAAVMMATKGLGSTVVLNVLLWLSPSNPGLAPLRINLEMSGKCRCPHRSPLSI